VFTERGDALILYRLASAIEELEGLGFDGLRVHRSHWVRRDSVTAGGHEGRQPWVVLTNGLKVPVSQTYREIARLAGLPI
jgi:DNA-binding LytR/AlgR family response regulator